MDLAHLRLIDPTTVYHEIINAAGFGAVDLTESVKNSGFKSRIINIPCKSSVHLSSSGCRPASLLPSTVSP